MNDFRVSGYGARGSEPEAAKLCESLGIHRHRRPAHFLTSSRGAASKARGMRPPEALEFRSHQTKHLWTALD